MSPKEFRGRTWSFWRTISLNWSSVKETLGTESASPVLPERRDCKFLRDTALCDSKEAVYMTALHGICSNRTGLYANVTYKRPEIFRTHRGYPL